MLTLGIDVSKLKLDCYFSQGIENKPMHKNIFEVSNDSKGFEKIASYLKRREMTLSKMTIVLEPTCVYHIELIYWLYSQNGTICLANPKDVRNYARSLGRESKTDRLDCFVLAQFGLTRTLQIWKPKSQNIRKLDILIRTRHQIVQDRVKEQVRLSEMTKISHEIAGRYHESLLTMLEEMEKKITAEIKELISNDMVLNKASKRLQTIPGVGPILASLLIVLFSNHTFETGNQATAFCGIVPKEFQSGTSVLRQVRMTKRGPGEIRAVLRMAAAALLTSKKQSRLKSYYEHLVKEGKPRACALGAVMRKLIVVAFAVWRNETDYCYELVA